MKNSTCARGVHLLHYPRARIWWNWQTRYFEVVVPQGVQVQVLLSAPVFLKKLRNQVLPDTALTQETAESESAKVKFPKRIKHRGRVLATIYGKSKGRDSYRVAWHVAGQRRMASFPSYSLAKRHADASGEGFGQRLASHRLESRASPRCAGRAGTSRGLLSRHRTPRFAAGRRV